MDYQICSFVLCWLESFYPKELRHQLNGPLQHVLGAELRFNGRNDIYRALFPENGPKHGLLKRLFTDKAETLDQRRQGVLKRHASKKHGRFARKEQRAEFAERSKAATIDATFPERILSTQTLRYAWGVTKAGYNKAKNRTAQAINSGLINPAIFVAREAIQEPIAQFPLKKKFAAAAATIGATGTALNMAGVQNAFTTAASTMTAATTSIANSSAIFIGLNIPQDAALHTVAVGACMGLGTLWYYAVNRGIKPAIAGTIEASKTMLTGRKKQNDGLLSNRLD